MKYSQLKEVLIGMFQYEKLQMTKGEWGFFNEIERKIKRIGYAVNLSLEVIETAQKADVDFLLTHHDSWEFIYGLKESCDHMLMDREISHAFFHAPLDDADFGTSASLAKALGVNISEKAMPYAGIYYGGVIGERAPVEFDSFAERLRDVLHEDIRCFKNNGKPVHKIAVAAGAGNMTGEMRIAASAGCDTYVTGEYVLYSQVYAQHMGMNLLVGSHTNTEILGIESMARLATQGEDVQLVKIKEPNY